MTIFPARKMCISLLPPLLFVFVWLCGVHVSCPHDENVTCCLRHITPETKEESKNIRYIFT